VRFTFVVTDAAVRFVLFRPVDFFAADLRVVDLRVVDFRAVVFRAVDLRAVVFRPAVLRAVLFFLVAIQTTFPYLQRCYRLHVFLQAFGFDDGLDLVRIGMAISV